jgi:diguanylate cyclase (GGDEF)-like protein/PAS domain S-box-containing protein
MSLSSSTDDLEAIHSRKVIRLGFSLVILIIGFIVVFGLVRINKIHESLAEVVNTELAAIEMLFHMQQTSRDRSVLLYRIATSNDPFERDEFIQHYSLLGAEFGGYRSKLNELNLDVNEREMLKQQRNDILLTMDFQQQVIDLAAAGKISEANNILNNQAIPAQDKILSSINTLLSRKIADSHTHAKLIQEQQIQTRILMAAAGVLGAIFAVLIASFVNRRMGSLISGISSSRQKLQNANISLKSLNLAMDKHNIVSISNVAGNITYVNDAFCQVSEYGMDELLGNNHRLLKSGMHPDSLYEEMWHAISSGNMWQGEVCNRAKSGKQYWVSTTIVPFLDDNGLPCQYISVRTDITAIKEAQLLLIRNKDELEKRVQERTEELQEREQVMHSITTAAQDAVTMVNSNGKITFWNPAAEKLFGYSAVEIMGINPMHSLVPARYHEVLQTAFPQFIQSGTGALIGTTTELHALRNDGSEFPIEISISSVKIKNDWHAVAIVRDITIRKLAEEQLQQLATTDTLTGVFNRRRFNEFFTSELARAKRYGTTFGMIILDIDHFKHINDTYGHQAGDGVLVQLSSLISSNLRNTDVFARWGGEEFVILTLSCEVECPRQLSEKLRALIEKHAFPEVGKITCSFGITEFREGDNQETMVKRADTCLYRAKESGRNRVESDLNHQVHAKKP